jgi:hypothetical protein
MRDSLWLAKRICKGFSIFDCAAPPFEAAIENRQSKMTAG